MQTGSTGLPTGPDRSRQALRWSLVTGAAAAGVVVAPQLAERGYAGDSYGCDLGSIGAAIGGAVLGLIAFTIVLAVAAAHLSRGRLLLQAPVAFFLLTIGLPGLSAVPGPDIPLSPCGDDQSVLVLLAVAVASGATTFLVGRGTGSPAVGRRPLVPKAVALAVVAAGAAALLLVPALAEARGGCDSGDGYTAAFLLFGSSIAAAAALRRQPRLLTLLLLLLPVFMLDLTSLPGPVLSDSCAVLPLLGPALLAAAAAAAAWALDR